MTRPAHPRRPSLPAVVYEAGHFLALVREHNWPPRFEARMPTAIAEMVKGRPRSTAAMEARERMAITGAGWGAGTLKDAMPGTPSTVKPAWMMRRRAA